MRQPLGFAAMCVLSSFVSGCGGGRGGLFVVDLKGDQPRRVVSGCIQSFSWAPDGTSIAFTRLHGNQSSSSEVVRLSGARVRFGSGGSDRSIDWSPDGSRIVYEGSQGLVVASAAGGSTPRSIWRTTAYSPAWAPGGKQIAFATFGAQGGRIAVVRPDGSGVKYLTGKIAEPEPVLWFPDGQRLLFRRFADNALWVVNTDGSGLRRIARLGNLADTVPASIAPDGRRVAYSDVVAGYLHPSDRIYVVKDDGSEKRNVGIGSVGGWSPDGRLLVFANRSVYIVNARDGRRRKVAPKASDGGIGIVIAAWSSRNQIAYLDNADTCGGDSS